VHFRPSITRVLIGLLLHAALPGSPADGAQPTGAPILPLSEIRPGMKGEVWTVFRGTQPEPFTVEVSGVILNALGPGKSIILCELTDPRVQNMGAVAGMSGSPLYIDGRLAGALSYQLQRFETVHYAGFTPIADLLEVARLPSPEPGSGMVPPAGAAAGAQSARVNRPAAIAGLDSPLRSLTPVFTFSGVDPEVTALFEPQFRALGLSVASVGGSYGSQDSGWSVRSSALDSMSPAPNPKPGLLNPPPAPVLQPGDAVSVALATGDITIAGTGTVSRVDGAHLLAFGHPLMRLGAVELPMAATDIVAILPSQMNSVKVANVGPVIGTISQDRLSAVYGELGRIPEMIPVEVTLPGPEGGRTLHFQVARQPQLAPMLAAVGVAQAILGSNEAGLAEGFRIRREVTFPGGQAVSTDDLYAGPQGFAAGLGDFVSDLGQWLQNPFAQVFPGKVAFTVEPLAHNPQSVLDVVQLSRTTAAPGDTVQLTLSWRDYQGARSSETVDIPVARSWAGKNLEVVVANGPELDDLTGHPRFVPTAQIRSFEEYLSALDAGRHPDGLYVAVVEKAGIFLDQTRMTLDYPGSIERIARGADERRFQRSEAAVPLWERHLLLDRLIPANLRRSLRVTE